MIIKNPTHNPHGLNNNLLFTIENNSNKAPLKVDIIRTDTNAKIGSKLYSPADTIEVGTTGYLTPILKVNPINSGQEYVVLDNERAIPIRITANETRPNGDEIQISSQEVIVVAAKENIEFDSVMNSTNEFVAPVSKDDSFEIAIMTSGEIIYEAILTFVHKNAKNFWTKKINMPIRHKGIVIFNLDMKQIAIEMVNKNLNWSDYDEIKCTVENKYTSKYVAQYTIPIANRRKNSTRLCWKNRLGAVEYYTFPYLKRRLTKIDKDRVQTASGGRITKAIVEKIIEIQSDFEVKAAIQQIAQIAQSTDVWLCEKDKFTPVIVMDSEITIEEETCTYIQLKISLSQEEEYIA